MNSKPNGFILYEGASTFDGENIVVVVTGYETSSANPKTGDMLQTWIIKADDLPSSAIKEGTDSSVCGSCPLRGKVCYVYMAPVNNIWRQYKEGCYPKVSNSILQRIKIKRRLLRLGSYGDPCAVPIEVWQSLIKASAGYTGYTHAWQYADQRWKQYLMASVESTTLMEKAHDLGWRTFRIVKSADQLTDSEMMCKNWVDEDIKCEDCKLCNGKSNKPSIANVVHGAKWKVNNYKELVSV
jgi:hypothetical protein